MNGLTIKQSCEQLFKLSFCLSLVTMLSACSALKGAFQSDDSSSSAFQLSSQIRQDQAEQALAPARLKDMFVQAVAAHQDGDIDLAVKRYEAFLTEQPEHAGAWFNLAQIAREAQNDKLAAEHAGKALAADGGHKQSANLLGQMARERGKFELSEQYYRHALNTDPLYQPALRNLAILLDLYQGRLDEALVLYQRLQNLGNNEPRLKDWIFDLKRRLEARS